MQETYWKFFHAKHKKTHPSVFHLFPFFKKDRKYLNCLILDEGLLYDKQERVNTYVDHVSCQEQYDIILADQLSRHSF